MERVTSGVEILDQAECWNLLATHAVGRLAVDIVGRPDIFPINYLVHAGALVFRTGAGTKLAAAALLHHVAFEIDGFEPETRTAWSVVLHGEAHLIENMQEVWDAQDLPLFPWVASHKPDFVRITPSEVTGRRFHLLDDVTPDDSIGWSGSEASSSAQSAERAFHPGEPHLLAD